MQKGFALGALLLILVAVSSAQADQIKWAKNYDAAVALAKHEHKLVMADFYADW